jgi:hypothetical protein
MIKKISCCLFFIVCVILLVTFSERVSALGISPSSIIMDYDSTKGIDETFEFTLISNSGGDYNVTLTLEGAKESIAKYVTLSKSELFLPQGDRRTFKVYLKIPKGIDDEFAGPQGFSVLAEEKALQAQGGISVTTAVRVPAKISFPYPGQYLEVTKLQVSKINKGENAFVNWTVTSRGKEDLVFIAELISISSDGDIVLSRKYDAKAISPGESFSVVSEELNTKDLNAGLYGLILNLSYGENSRSGETKLYIGTEDVNLLSYSPKNFVVGEMTKMNVTVENLWNGYFSTYAVINISGITATTPTRNMLPFGTVGLDQYVDATSLPLGEYSGSIIIHFGNFSKTFPITINVVPKEAPVIEEIEEKKGMSTITWVMIALVIIILTLLAIILVRMKRKH